VKKTDLAWAAGFLDGEGYFQSTKTQYVQRKDRRGLRIKSYSYFKINAAQTQSNVYVLNKLKRILGGSITGPYRHKSGSNQSPYYTFCLCTNAEKMFRKMYPYLERTKRLQGSKAISKSKKENSRLRGKVYGV
jgi:hypothetical protein